MPAGKPGLPRRRDLLPSAAVVHSGTCIACYRSTAHNSMGSAALVPLVDSLHWASQGASLAKGLLLPHRKRLRQLPREPMVLPVSSTSPKQRSRLSCTPRWGLLGCPFAWPRRSTHSLLMLQLRWATHAMHQLLFHASCKCSAKSACMPVPAQNRPLAPH